MAQEKHGWHTQWRLWENIFYPTGEGGIKLFFPGGRLLLKFTHKTKTTACLPEYASRQLEGERNRPGRGEKRALPPYLPTIHRRHCTRLCLRGNPLTPSILFLAWKKMNLLSKLGRGVEGGRGRGKEGGRGKPHRTPPFIDPSERNQTTYTFISHGIMHYSLPLCGFSFRAALLLLYIVAVDWDLR